MLKVLSLNCCSIRSLSKTGKFAALINEHNVNIVIGCGSQINESFATSEVFPSNFAVFCRDRSLEGGGAFLCFENTVDVSEEPTLQVDAELIWARLKIHKRQSIYICSLYRTPNNLMEPLSNSNNSLNKLFSCITQFPTVIVAGYF